MKHGETFQRSCTLYPPALAWLCGCWRYHSKIFCESFHQDVFFKCIEEGLVDAKYFFQAVWAGLTGLLFWTLAGCQFSQGGQYVVIVCRSASSVGINMYSNQLVDTMHTNLHGWGLEIAQAKCTSTAHGPLDKVMQSLMMTCCSPARRNIDEYWILQHIVHATGLMWLGLQKDPLEGATQQNRCMFAYCMHIAVKLADRSGNQINRHLPTWGRSPSRAYTYITYTLNDSLREALTADMHNPLVFLYVPLIHRNPAALIQAQWRHPANHTKGQGMSGIHMKQSVESRIPNVWRWMRMAFSFSKHAIVAIVVAMDKEEAAEPQPAQADCKILRYSLNSCNKCRERLRGICIANLDEIALDSLYTVMILMWLFVAFYHCNSTMIPYLGNNME